MPIRTATTEADLDTIRVLFRNYAEELGIDLCFQDFQEELDTLPGSYAPPQGTILLAENEQGTATGCVALKPLEPPAICEMKRLYVIPKYRGHGLGRRLAIRILEAAQSRNYTTMRLDTLDSLHAALALYRDLGFKETTAYYTNPLPNVIYMEKELT